MNRKERAMSLFESGYNCAQSVALAFSDLTGADETLIAKLSSSFGGGMGRLREVCGAVTGAFMVLGLLYGYDSIEAHEEKAAHYARIQQFAAEFSAQTGSIICRELLGLETKTDSPTPEKRTAEYYKKRPCKELVGLSAEILDGYIAKNQRK